MHTQPLPRWIIVTILFALIFSPVIPVVSMPSSRTETAKLERFESLRQHLVAPFEKLAADLAASGQPAPELVAWWTDRTGPNMGLTCA